MNKLEMINMDYCLKNLNSLSYTDILMYLTKY